MKENKYTITWSDNYYNCYLDQIKAQNQTKALHQWLKKFETKTARYGLTYDECYYITKKMEKDLVPYKMSSGVTEKPCRNVWGKTFLGHVNACVSNSPPCTLDQKQS